MASDMTHEFRVIQLWYVQPGLWLSHHITRSSTYQTKYGCCQHQRCVAFSLASSPEPVQHGCTYQDSKTPAGIASGICEACKPPNYDKVTTLWGEYVAKLVIWKCLRNGRSLFFFEVIRHFACVFANNISLSFEIETAIKDTTAILQSILSLSVPTIFCCEQRSCEHENAKLHGG